MRHTYVFPWSIATTQREPAGESTGISEQNPGRHSLGVPMFSAKLRRKKLGPPKSSSQNRECQLRVKPLPERSTITPSPWSISVSDGKHAEILKINQPEMPPRSGPKDGRTFQCSRNTIQCNCTRFQLSHNPVQMEPCSRDSQDWLQVQMIYDEPIRLYSCIIQ